MKKYFYNIHNNIDKISIFLFLYCSLVCICLYVLAFIPNEYVHAICAIFLPLIIVNRNNVNRFNSLLHRLFGFVR